MRLEVKNENYNRFLKRKEFNIDIEHPEEATPSMAAVQQLVAKQTNSQAEKTEIKEIMSSRGSSTSRCLAFVWDDKAVKDLSKKETDAQAKENTPAEGKTESTPAEESKPAKKKAEEKPGADKAEAPKEQKSE